MNKKIFASVVLPIIMVVGVFVSGASAQTQTSTLVIPCYSISMDLRYGSYNSQVALLQKFLVANGYMNMPSTWSPTSYFGFMTQQAVVLYQQRNALTATGVVGPETRAKIFASCGTSNPIPSGSLLAPAKLQASSVSTPTITSSVVASNYTDMATTTYIATFNVRMQAVSGDVTIYLPGSTNPSIQANNNYLVLYRNNLEQSFSSNTWSRTVSYMAPTGTTRSADGKSFVIPVNTTVIVPVQVSFSIGNEASPSQYGLRLARVDWANVIGLQTSNLTGSGWSTPYAQVVPATPTPTPASTVTVVSPKGGEYLVTGGQVQVGFGPVLYGQKYTVSLLGKTYESVLGVLYGTYGGSLYQSYTIPNDAVATNVSYGSFTIKVTSATGEQFYSPYFNISRQIVTSTSGPYHSADIDHDWKISQSELDRVTVLFNYRSGTTRTGEYHYQSGTVDNYDVGPGTITTYHSADTNKNGKIELLELTRVIELKNSIGYKVQSGTEDGFAPITTTSQNPVPPTSSVVSNISLSAVSPLESSIPVADTVNGQYLALPLLVFDVSAGVENLHLRQINVGFIKSGTGSLGAAYLYQGSTLVSSAPVSNNVASFSNIMNGTVGASIPAYSKVPYTVKVDILGVTSGSLRIAAYMSNMQTILTSNDSASSVVGTITGNYQTVVSSYASSPTPTPTPAQTGVNSIVYYYAPTTVTTGQTFQVTVVNNGTKAWGASHDLGLSTSNLATNLQFVNLGSTPQYGSKTVTFTAPTDPGTYVIRAVEQNVAWFGTNQTITVTGPTMVSYPQTTSLNCGGTAPSGLGVVKGSATYTSGYSGPTIWTPSPSTPNACQWTCSAGYSFGNNTCVAQTSTVSTTNTASYTTAPSIRVISPNGGETLQIGSTYTIRWSSANIPSSDYIHVMLASANGDDSAYIKSWLPSTATEYAWTVNDFYPSVVGGSYKVSVKTSSGSVRDVSDSTYTFSAAATTASIQPVNFSQTSSVTTYSQLCGGTAPSGTAVVKGVGSYSTGYGTTNWTYVTGTPNACQWSCSAGYGPSGNGCAVSGTTYTYPTTQPCGGTLPSSNSYTQIGNGIYSTGYGTTQWTFVSGTPNACQYSCINSGVPNGAGCSAPQTTVSTAPQTLVNGITYNLLPASVLAGEVINVLVTNSGTKPWGASHDLGLSSSDLSVNYQFVNLGTTAPGTPKNVSFRAPTTPGTYVIRAVEQNVAWFGTNQTITVTSPTSAIGSPYSAAIIDALTEWYMTH